MSFTEHPLTFTRKPSLLSLDPASRRAIFDHLAPSDLNSLSQVSYSLDRDVADYWAHLVKAMCFRFAPKPLALLSAMGLYRSVFSGSAVLALVTRAGWSPGDLDLYCPKEFFVALIYHFAIVQGFQLQNPEVLDQDVLLDLLDVPAPAYHGYLDARQILNVAHMRRGNIDIDIVQSTSTSALTPLAAFWTTAVQNFISPTMLCIAYPSLTERNVALLAPRHLVDLQHPPPHIVDLIRKYESRHFRFAVRPYALTNEQSCNGLFSSACSTAVRSFGDVHSLVIRTQAIQGRIAASNPEQELLRRDNVFWWRGGYTCGLECGAVGARVWPGMLIPPKEDEDELA